MAPNCKPADSNDTCFCDARGIEGIIETRLVPLPAQSLNVKPQLATASGLASRQGNGVGQQTRTAQATSGGKRQSVSSAKPYQASSTTPITVGGQTVNVFVSRLLPHVSPPQPLAMLPP